MFQTQKERTNSWPVAMAVGRSTWAPDGAPEIYNRVRVQILSPFECFFKARTCSEGWDTAVPAWSRSHLTLVSGHWPDIKLDENRVMPKCPLAGEFEPSRSASQVALNSLRKNKTTATALSASDKRANSDKVCKASYLECPPGGFSGSISDFYP